MAERTTDTRAEERRGDGRSSIAEPVVVGAVVGGLANLIAPEVLFPGWGAVAGALIGLGCGVVLGGRGADAAEADGPRVIPAPRGRAEGVEVAPTTADEPAPDEPAGDGEASPAVAASRGAVAGAKARVIAKSAAPDDTAARVVPPSSIVAVRSLPDADDVVHIEVLGRGAPVATGPARPGHVSRVALGVPTAADGPRTWAQLLVHGFAASGDVTCTDVDGFGRLLAVSRQAWAQQDADERTTASFLGLEVAPTSDGLRWRAVAAGPVALVAVDDAGLVARLPAQVGDDADPIGTERGDGDLLRRSSARLAPGQSLLVCSPRVASWVGDDGDRARRLVAVDAADLPTVVPGSGPAVVVRVSAAGS